MVTEPRTRIAELESGSSDAILSTLTSNTDRIEETDGMTLMRSDAVNVDYIGFNTSKEPFDNPKIRQAISHAFDSETVLDGVYNDSGIPANGPLAPSLLGYSEELESLDYDMARAEELLAETGAEDLAINLMVNDDNPERLDVALWIQESLSEIGVTLNTICLFSAGGIQQEIRMKQPRRCTIRIMPAIMGTVHFTATLN